MTTIARILERYTMPLEEPENVGRDEWFLDWVLRSPKEAGTHLTAGWSALNALREDLLKEDIASCREYFGGMGAQALMVNELFSPTDHDVLEFSEQAVAHLQKLGTHITARHADAYDPSSCVPADLVVLDFGDLTVWKTRDGEQHRKLLDRVFAHRPKAVLLTDIACRYLHLHRERYETLLGSGTCQSYETYLYALVARLEGLYGYTLLEGYSHRWSTVMALVPGGAADRGFFHETPDSPVGLELL